MTTKAANYTLRNKLKELLTIYENTDIDIPQKQKQSIYFGLILAYQNVDQHCQKPQLSIVKGGTM